jgi:hypothetical protein
MGIPRPVVRLLFEEGRRRPFTGSVLQLGRCFVYLTWPEMKRWARRDGFALREDVEVEPSHDPRLARRGCISDRTFFRALGFDRVESLDVFLDEEPTFRHDLNRPIPEELAGRYDVVFDPGSLVHVFDQRQAWTNLARLVAPGGRAIHGGTPSSNHLDIGLYMFSPMLFADFYAANGWSQEALAVCEFEPLWFRGRFRPPSWWVRDYLPGVLDTFRLGGLGRRPLAIWAVATKGDGATVDRVPQQGLAAARAQGAEWAKSGVLPERWTTPSAPTAPRFDDDPMPAWFESGLATLKRLARPLRQLRQHRPAIRARL